MGRFIATKFSDHQHRVIRKKHAKSISRCAAAQPREKQQAQKPRKVTKEQHVKKISEEPPPSGSEVSVEKPGVEEVEDSNTEFQDLRIEVVINSDSTKKCLKLVRPVGDLFADDDFKARYDQYTKYNLIFIIFDEIALEGLDGITIEAYWKRIQHALKLENLTYSLKEIIWQIICLNEKIQFFELPVAREDLVMINRNSGDNKEGSMFTDIGGEGIDIYKVEVANKESGQWGSCATLSTRVDISTHVREMSLNQALDRYGNKLVFMADEDLRRLSLVDDLVDPSYELTTIEYCLLEKIGRARDMGDISLVLTNCFNIDTKTICHYCKRLDKSYLITRQNCFISSSNMEQGKVGRLFHLRRFYQKKKQYYIIIIESIVNYLKKCPGYRAPYTAIRALLGGNIPSKFFKHQDFLKYVDTNICIPYREYYPDATYKEYMTKSLTKERVVQIMQLKDPYLNISACWAENQNADSSDDDDEDGGSNINRGRRVYNKDFVRDVYQYILSKGIEGVKTTDLLEVFDIDFLTTRSVLRKLTYRQLIHPRRRDLGRQTVNQFVAKCLLQKSDYKVSQPTPVRIGTSSALEKLKEKQRQKIATLPKERIYTAEQLAADREHQLLSLNASSLPAVNFEIPSIVCEYFTAERKSPQTIREINVFLVKLWQVIEPFKVHLSFPKIPDVQKGKLKKILPGERHNQQLTEPKTDHPGEFLTLAFRPDNFSKAFLLQALLDKVNMNEPAIIDFLDPDKASKPAAKRPKGVLKDVQSKVKTNAEPTVVGAAASTSGGLGMYMGSNPTMVLREKDEASGFLTEIHVSNPINDYITGDITQYEYDPSIVTTERVLFRIALILKTIQQQQIFEEANRFLKLIFQEELQTGYNKRIDRKSLHRILKRLADEGYIKIFGVILVNGDSKKTQTYVCHPDVSLHHHLIQESVAQLKDKLFCYVNNKSEETVSEPATKKVAPDPEPKKSPFIEDDVLRSINEIKQLTTKTIKSKLNLKSGKFYGRRPKFARLSLLHELLFYLVYELDKSTQPLPKADVAQLFQSYQIKLKQSDLDNLPPVYSREISWKTFIPPLPYHQSWDAGWALLIDIVLRFPITLITSCYSVNFVSTELQEVLQHPIKRFYLLKNVSPNIRMMVMYRRQFIHDMYNQLVLLSYCGLTQFGPQSFHDKEKSFFYLNRRATLWDTTSSKPGYQKIEDKPYPKHSFYLESMDDVLKYWSTMKHICMHTHLNIRSSMEGKTITLVDTSAKPSLNQARSVKTQANVEEFDTGDLPGDHQGAAGLDSSLWSYRLRSWYFFAAKNEANRTVSLDMLKLDQVANNQVSFDQLKLPVVSSKYYLAKPLDHRPIMPARKLKATKTAKHRPVVKRTVPMIKRKSPGEKKIGLDSVDKATLRRLGGLRYRPNWSEKEDRLLILLKIASVFITPGTNKQVISYSALRDVLYIAEPKSRDKTTRNIANRIKILQKGVPFLSNIESRIPNLYKLVPMAKYFVPFRKFVLYGDNPSGPRRKFKLSDPELQNAFLFLAYYFVTHQKEVEASLHGRNTCTDYFNEENIDFFKRNIQPFDVKKNFYSEPQNEDDIRKNALKNTIQSALSHKSENSAWSLQMYKIYQQFSEDVLKMALREMKEQRMIQSRKDPAKTFFTPYRLSLYYIFAQSCTFWYHTMEEAYKAFVDLKHSPSDMDFSYEAMEEKKYGQMFAVNEVLSFAFSDTTIHLKFPEHHLILNPEVGDHSEVIEELAKRYQAKLKNDQKEAELQVEFLQPGSKLDDEDVETTESEPGPSSVAAPEEPDIEVIPFDDDEPLDLSITTNNSTTIDSLKHWISDCIDTERVRSPSPELLTLEMDQEREDWEAAGEDVNQSSSAKEKEDRVLSLEEIKEEMLKPYDCAEKRLVPYISDLTKLLSENFEELESDDGAYYLMKKHFVQQYPSLEKVTADGLNGHYLSEFLENRTSLRDLWVSVERETHLAMPSDKGVAFDEILEKDGTIEDVSLAFEMLSYIDDKNIYGATGYELKDKFSCYPSNCSLELIVQILVKHHIILRTGVDAVTYVHHKHQNPWLTDTFMLTEEQVSLLPDKTASREDMLKLEADIQGVDITKWIKIKPLPWATVDGTLDKDMFKMWLSNVFTYCIENPTILLTTLCDKFCYLKPVDVFYLVETLEQIGALEMRRLLPKEVDLFSEYEYSDDCKATALDKFEEIYIEPNNIGFTSLGSFFHNL